MKPKPSAGGRVWAFRLILLLGAPLVFFLVLEGGLRVGGFGHDPAFFIKDESTPGWYRTNPRFTELFLPASFGLKPLNFRLPRAKPAGTKRVFVLGESAAMGVPEPAFGLVPQLQFDLRGGVPARVEVYNLGVTAINSHAVRRILDEARAFEPDLFVIYMGNNEVVGPYGAGAVVTKGVLPVSLVRASLWVRSTRTGQLIQAIAARLRPAGSGFRDWRGMEMFADKAVPANDPRLPAVYRNFSANLDAMLAAAHAAGVKVVLSTVAVNVRDCAPFVSQSDPNLPADRQAAWRAAWTAGRSAEAAGDWPRARDLLTRAVTLDPGHAGAHYLLATILETTGDAAGAREHYFAALQQDALRFRADATINQLIRGAAARDRDNVRLVDAARQLGADPAATGALAGGELFFEHVHLTWEGNKALAGVLAGPAGSVLAAPATTAQFIYSTESYPDAMGFSEVGRLTMLRRMDELNARPPFTGQLRYAADRTRLARQIAASENALAAPGAIAAINARLAAALERDPENPSLLIQVASLTLQRGDHEGALRLLDRLAAVQPFSAETAALRAVALQGAGRMAEAEAVLQQAIVAEPYYFQSYLLLVRLWVGAGRTSEAIQYLAKLLERMPDSRQLRSTYAQLFAADGDWPLAETQWREVLRLVPDDESALAPLLKHLAATNRPDDALALMRQAHAYNPRSFANNQRLVEYYDSRNDAEQTVAFMQDLAESGPVNALLFRDLALNLDKVGRHAEVHDVLLRGRRIAQQEGETELLAEFDRLLKTP